MSSGIKSKSNPPNTIFNLKTQFFHVFVLTCFQGVNTWAPQCWAKDFNLCGMGQQFVLYFFGQTLKLCFKGFMKEDLPAHGLIMMLKSYDFKCILQKMGAVWYLDEEPFSHLLRALQAGYTGCLPSQQD